jgi:hypothetical protein
LELSLSLSRFINFYLRYVPVVSSVSYKWLNWLCFFLLIIGKNEYVLGIS